MAQDSPEQPPKQKKTKNRPTKLTIQTQKQSIIGLLKTGASDSQTKQQLKLTDKTYERRIKEMQTDSLNEVLNQQSAEAKADLLRQSIAKIQNLEIMANNIALNSTDNTTKLAAMDRLRVYAIDIAKLLTEGPFIFNVIQRDGLHIGDQRTTAELRDPSLLQQSLSANPTSEPTEDPNRVA